jgi:transcriptional regulator with XRE-family HTH domain
MPYRRNPPTRFGRQPARDLLSSSGWTMRDAAREMNVDYQHFARSLFGRVLPDSRVRTELPKLLGLPLEELFTEEVCSTPARSWSPELLYRSQSSALVEK